MSMSKANRERLEKLEKVERDVEVKTASDSLENLKIRDRLLRRLIANTIQVEFEDDMGKFNIEARLLSPEEQTHVSDERIKLLRFREELAKAPTTDIEELRNMEKRGAALMDELYKIVADICVDKTLDYEYWRKGSGYNADVPLKLLSEAIGASQRTEQDTARFRRKQ